MKSTAPPPPPASSCPHDTPDQRANTDELEDLSRRDFGVWSRPESHRYFLAGGGREEDFEPLFALTVLERRRALEAIRNGTWTATNACPLRRIGHQADVATDVATDGLAISSY